MKLLLCVALLVFVTVLSAQEADELGTLEFDEMGEGHEVPTNPLEEPDDVKDDDDDDADENEEEGEDEIPTTQYPKKQRWPGYECLSNARLCFKNATDCQEHLACYEAKSSCMQSFKKGKQILSMKKRPMICKSIFNKCLEKAGSDCFKKFMCYQRKGFCYRSRGRSNGRTRRPYHHRRPDHHRRPTMCPKMLKCRMEWKRCFVRANNCSQRLQCLYDFHDCKNRSRPTSPPPTRMSPGNEEHMNEHRRRWNPELEAKCKREFQKCIENASLSCPLKMRCFWRMKMCFHQKPYNYYNKMVTSTTMYKFGGKQMNRGWKPRGKPWGSRRMGGHSGDAVGRRKNRGSGGRFQGKWKARGHGGMFGK